MIGIKNLGGPVDESFQDVIFSQNFLNDPSNQVDPLGEFDPSSFSFSTDKLFSNNPPPTLQEDNALPDSGSDHLQSQEWCDGYEAGHKEGYQQGQHDGYEAGKNMASQMQGRKGKGVSRCNMMIA